LQDTPVAQPLSTSAAPLMPEIARMLSDTRDFTREANQSSFSLHLLKRGHCECSCCSGSKERHLCEDSYGASSQALPSSLRLCSGRNALVSCASRLQGRAREHGYQVES
jgi:hypothetical protein